MHFIIHFLKILIIISSIAAKTTVLKFCLLHSIEIFYIFD